MATTDGSTPIPARKPLLALSTLTERDVVLIDAVPYELLKPEQMSLVNYTRIKPLVPRFEHLMKAPTLTDAEATELMDITTRLVRACLVLPGTMTPVGDDVLARLADDQLLEIVVGFAGLSQLLRRLLRAATETPPATTTTATSPRSTGAKPSRASSGSIRAPRRRRG
jgi:hypothetical protein